MSKHIIDFEVVENRIIHELYSLLILTPHDGQKLPETSPGQFVQIDISMSKSTFLRRPISINRIDKGKNHLWLLIRNAGKGTKALLSLAKGDILNILLPLGNLFDFPATNPNKKVLLIGGGVGVAPLLYWGETLKANGHTPEFLIGARSAKDVLLLDEFEKIGTVYVVTEDGSMGEKGLVTAHSVLQQEIGQIYCCGPSPMMKAVAAIAKERGIACEVTLENKMACGLGVCLCCVEDTMYGNLRVCTEGPVFNINQLKW